MKFGTSMSFPLALAGKENYSSYLEKLTYIVDVEGLDSIWFADRTTYPFDIQNLYPEKWGKGKMDVNAQKILEPIASLSFVAALTSRLKLGISVLQLPLRHPVLNAKMITTLDVLSQGRVLFGIGVGWMPEEFENMFVNFKNRGGITNEHLELFKILCLSDPINYKGEFFQVENQTFFPKPVQNPHPPILVGGNSKAAIKRSVIYGDAWFPINISPTEVKKGRDQIHKYCRENNINSDNKSIYLHLPLNLGDKKYDSNNERLHFSGEIKDIKEDIKKYNEAGVEHIVFSIPSEDKIYIEETIKKFAFEIANN